MNNFDKRPLVTTNVHGRIFQTPVEYINIHAKGVGGFSLVCAATKGTRPVAIKKVDNTFRSKGHAIRIFREVNLLRQIQHENVIRLFDVYMPNQDDVYLVTDLMDTDLKNLIDHNLIQPEHRRYFMYQMLRGLKYIHSAGIVHRDLKPTNILVNRNCDLKICDFGLARVSDIDMSEYVCTRWYRAPEVFFGAGTYNTEMDMWSVGCIFAEMINSKVLLRGRDHANQIYLIIEMFGMPSSDVVIQMSKNSEDALTFLQNLRIQNKTSRLREVFRNLEESQFQLMEGLLQFNPANRLTASSALESPYLQDLHDPSDEPVAPYRFEDNENAINHSVDEWRKLVQQDIYLFHHPNTNLNNNNNNSNSKNNANQMKQ